MIRQLAMCVTFVFAMSSPVWAQGAQPAPGTDPHHPAPAPGQRPSGAPPGGMGGMMGGMPMMVMMCPMMGAGMTGGMMPMPSAAGPADSPRMLQMRGEMLKAMGDILMKYGKLMEGGTRP